MKVFDTHCHPQFSGFDQDRDQMLKRAFDAGVNMICVGTDFEMSRKAIELAEQHEGIWASVGLHPNDNLDELYDQELYVELAKHPKVVAIGEVGLDYYRTTEPTKQKAQHERFLKQIDLAVSLNKPLIIHCRDGATPSTSSGQASAHSDMIKILETCNVKRETSDTLQASSFKLHGVVHSFTGTFADAKKYVSLGFYLGLNGIITFARQYDDIVTSIPLESILLETDAPYLTPEPNRGKRNEPSYVLYVAEQIALLRRISVEKVIEQTTKNAQTLFGLNL